MINATLQGNSGTCYVVSLPDGKFMGHISATDGKAIHVTISKISIQFLQEKNIIDPIEALACDGTNTNVGAEGGINHLIEVSIGRALQWNVCLVHASELPLRHLIIELELDGPTTGANTVGNKKNINRQPRKNIRNRNQRRIFNQNTSSHLKWLLFNGCS